MSRDPRNPSSARCPRSGPPTVSQVRPTARRPRESPIPGCDALTGRDILASAVLAYDGIHER
jgi:hypothetical protein